MSSLALIGLVLALASAEEGVDLDLPRPLPPEPRDGTMISAPRSPETTRREGEVYTLERLPGERYRYQGPGFTAEIAPDGHVSFAPRSTGPASRFGNVLRGERSPAQTGPGLPPAPSPYRPTPYDERENDLSGQPPRAPVAAPIVLDAGRRADLTDEFMRSIGDDPYRSAKARFLAATFEFRTALAAQTYRAQNTRAVGELRARLEGIWADPALTRSEKEEILLRMWKELRDDATSQEAADAIADFARRHLPASRAAAFERHPPAVAPQR